MNGERSQMRARTAWALIFVAALALGACGDDEVGQPVDPNPEANPEGEPGAEPEGGPEGEPEGEPEAEPEPEPEAEPEPDPEPEALVVIECGELERPEQGLCSVSAGSGNLVIRGDVLAPEGVLAGGEVLIDEGGTILCAACSCEDFELYARATRVTCAEGVISPGLINPHDHITFTQNSPGDWGAERYDHRHDWRRGIRGHNRIAAAGGASNAEISWGELRQLVGGTTSLVGSGGAGGFLRNLDRSSLHEELGQGEVELDTFPLGDTGGELRSMGCGYPSLPDASVVSEASWSPHVSEGIDAESRNEFLCLSQTAGGGRDLTADNGAFIHGVGLLAIDGRELALNGTAVIWSPRSNISLYGHTAQVTMLDRQGVLLALGTDWTPSGSINLQRELQCADDLNRDHLDGYFSDRDLWEMVTSSAAQALSMDDAIGSLRGGLLADIAVFARGDGANAYRAVIEATAGDTALVLRGGRPLFGDEALLAALPGGQEGCEAMPTDVCGKAKAICAQREVGQSFVQLQAANANSYELFFCDEPRAEPTCVPSRPGEFDGALTEDDLDGDGVVNELDNCPRVFNPVRPVDGRTQGDHDSDGVGDVCDPCPVDADTDDCSRPDPADSDADGILNVQDNCPSASNPEQDDADQDGKGDACDACPDEFNPGAEGCPATIYAIKTGGIAVGEGVVVEGVVTAVGGTRFFIQVPEADQDSDLGANFSGIFVFIPSDNDTLTIPSVGDKVRVNANVGDFFGQIQLTSVTSIAALASGVALPSPVEVTSAEVATRGPLADDLEGVLVRIECEVTALNPAAGPGDQDPTSEYVCSGGLKVNDLLYLTEPFPFVTDVLEVTGVLRFANDSSKLEPRGPQDIRFLQSTPPSLLAFGPARTFVEVGPALASAFPALTLEIDRPALPEGVVLTLQSGDPRRLTVPPSLTLAEGQAQAEVQLRGLVAGPDPVIVTARLGEASLQVEVVVLEANRLPVVASIEPLEITVSVGFATQVRVNLEVPASAAGARVALSASPGGLVARPAEVLVEPYALSATFDLSGVAEGSTTITASAGESSAEAEVEVTATPPVGFVISEIFYDPEGEDSGLEWVELFNGTGAAIDLSNFSLGSGGSDYTTLRVQLAGVIGPGQCFVVGGPQASDLNGNPTYSQVLDFTPDIQNSGATADAVGLFNVRSANINSASVPIDTVIFGTTNMSNLLDEAGQVGAVDVRDAPSGSSIERTPTAWRVQGTPTPNNCTVLF